MNGPPDVKTPRLATEAPSEQQLTTHPNPSAAGSQGGPEYRDDRRRFLIAMFMIGAVRSERVVERIAGEIEAAT
jgi:hypothetical protein